jgi:hypothetical protein
MFKKAFTILVLSLPTLVFSEDDDANTHEAYCCPLLPPQPVDSCQLPAGIFYPGAYTLGECSWDITIAGEYLYWVFIRDGGESSLGNRFRIVGEETDLEELYHRPGYQSAFRVDLGIGLPGCDFIQAEIIYTRYDHTTTNHIRAGEGEILGPRYFAPGFFASSALRSVFKANVNFLELAGGRKFYVSKRLMAKPTIGVKGWWTEQDTNLFFTTLNGATAFQLTKSKVWGIGPNFSVNVDALLWCGFYLTGRAGLWSAFNEFYKHRVQSNFEGAVVNVEKNGDKPYICQLFYESAAGFGWGGYFCDCAFHLDLKVSYEFINTFVSETIFSFGLPSREALIHGLSVRGEIAF